MINAKMSAKHIKFFIMKKKTVTVKTPTCLVTCSVFELVVTYYHENKTGKYRTRKLNYSPVWVIFRVKIQKK